MGMYGINNIWLINCYLPVEYTLIVLVFSCWVEGEWRRILRWSIPVFILLYLTIGIMTMQNIYSMNDVGRILENVLIIIAAVMVLYFGIITSEIPMLRSYKYWIITGTILYYVFTSFIMVMWKFHLAGMFPDLWLFNSVVAVITNMFWTMSFVWVRQKN